MALTITTVTLFNKYINVVMTLADHHAQNLYALAYNHQTCDIEICDRNQNVTVIASSNNSSSTTKEFWG